MPIEIDALGEAAKSLSTNPNVWIAVGNVLYTWITAPTPLSSSPTDPNEQDLMRYQTMCGLYQSMPGKSRIPIHWELVNGCPTHSSELAGGAERFRVMANDMQASSYPLKVNIIKIISSIERLYESLSKRTTAFSRSWKKYRPDGYEAMFFSDLAQWLSADLPSALITSQSTADMLQDRINFCKRVDNEVFIFRDDQGSHNPKERLQRIIKNLETLHQDICKSIKAASFNHCIDEINNNFLDMTTSAFDILHLILQGVNQRELQLDEFLKPNLVDEKVIALTQLTMGQWIIQTLNTLGITSNNFQSDGRSIDLDAIASHLNQDLSRLKLDKTGLHEFITNNSGETQQEKNEFAVNILRKVINIHREILNAYHVKSSLVHAARVGVNLGESWLYGNDDGKLIVTALLSVIRDANNQFKRTVEEFWNLYYNDTYVPYRTRVGLDNRDPTFRFLNNANDRFNRILICNRVINTSIDGLIEKARTYENDAEVIQQSTRTLIGNLYNVLRRKANADQDVVRGLANLFDRENSRMKRSNTQTGSGHPIAIEHYIVRFPIVNLPIYRRAKQLLVDKVVDQGLEPLFTLMDRPARFHTNTQERVYDDFLVPFNRIVNYWWFNSAIYSFTTFSMTELRDFYSRVNMIMTDLYAPEALSRGQITVTTTAGAIVQAERPNNLDKFDYLHNGEVTQWTTELMIVDQFFKSALYHFAKKYNDNPIARPIIANDYEILQVVPRGENIEVSIDKRLLTFAGGAFAIEMEKIKERLAASEAANADLRRQLTALAAQVKSLTAESERKNTAIALKDAELERTKDDLARQGIAIAQLQAQCQSSENRAAASSTNQNAFFSSGHSGSSASSGHAMRP